LGSQKRALNEANRKVQGVTKGEAEEKGEHTFGKQGLRLWINCRARVEKGPLPKTGGLNSKVSDKKGGRKV